MGNIADYLGAKAGGLADVSAALISALFEQGADVHVAISEYRALYNPRLPDALRRGIHSIRSLLPQMIAPLYGALPIGHDTGGIHDTVCHLDVAHNTGNGFLFQVYDANGLSWAIDEAMDFYNLPASVRHRHIERVMRQSAAGFNHAATARRYIDIYEKMLNRPLIHRQSKKFQSVYQKTIRKSTLAGLEGLRRHQPKFLRDAVDKLRSSARIHTWKRKEARDAGRRDNRSL